MKAIGWILAIFGGLSLMGAIAKGNSALGPLFWIGVGITLISICNNRNNDKDETKEENKE